MDGFRRPYKGSVQRPLDTASVDLLFNATKILLNDEQMKINTSQCRISVSIVCVYCLMDSSLDIKQTALFILLIWSDNRKLESEMANSDKLLCQVNQSEILISNGNFSVYDPGLRHCVAVSVYTNISQDRAVPTFRIQFHPKSYYPPTGEDFVTTREPIVQTLKSNEQHFILLNVRRRNICARVC